MVAALLIGIRHFEDFSLREIRAASKGYSLDLEVSILDYLLPAFDIRTNQIAEIFGCAGMRCRSFALERLLHIRRLEHGIQLVVKPLYHCRRHLRGTYQSPPHLKLEARQTRFIRRRQFGRQRRTVLACDGQAAHHSRVNVLCYRREAWQPHLQVAGNRLLRLGEPFRRGRRG